MKKPVFQAETGGATKSIARRFITFDLERLHQAITVLENEGFTVTFAPVELWQHHCLLTAWHNIRGEGFLIDVAELGHIIQYGTLYLDPFAEEDTEPRYKRSDNLSRIRHYAEAVMARAISEVQTAQPGARNQTLSRNAFLVGRYLLGWELNQDTVMGQLLEAALSIGLDHREANATIKRGLEAGSRNPRSPDELLDDVVGQAKPLNDIAARHLQKLSRKLAGGRT